jgi:hypothetical protein
MFKPTLNKGAEGALKWYVPISRTCNKDNTFDDLIGWNSLIMKRPF